MSRIGLIGFLATASLAAAAVAQVGHPAKGSWSGYWGTSDASKRRILRLLDWRDRQVTGVINPGPNQVPIEKAELDVATWTLRLEAEMPYRQRQSQNPRHDRPAHESRLLDHAYLFRHVCVRRRNRPVHRDAQLRGCRGHAHA